MFGIGYTILRLGESIIPLGLDQAVVRFGEWKNGFATNGTKVLVRKSLAISLGLGALSGAILYLSADYLAFEVFDEPKLSAVLRWIAPSMALSTGLVVSASATRISRRMHYFVIVKEILQPLLFIGLLISALLIGWGLRGVLGAILISYTVGLVVAVFMIQRLFGSNSKVETGTQISLPELFRYSIPASLGFVSVAFIMMIDRIILGLFRSVGDVGIYQAASTISTLFAILLSAFNLISMPLIAQNYQKAARQNLSNLYRMATRWGLYLSLPILIVILVTSEEILRVVFGLEYVKGALPLVLLSIAQFSRLAVGGVGVLLNSTGYQGLWFRLSGTALIMHLVLSFVIVPSFGIIGAAIATSAAFILLHFAGLISVRRKLDVWPYDRKTAFLLLMGMGELFILWQIDRLIHLKPFVQLIFICITAVLMTLVVFYVIGLESEDKAFLQDLRNRIRVISS